MGPHRRQALLLLLVMGIVALLAQVAGVGTTKSPLRAQKTSVQRLATIPGGSVPDIGSTKLRSTTITAGTGEVVRMRATAKLRVDALRGAEVTQVVCGIRLTRDDDPSWSLGTPYETIVLQGAGDTQDVSIARTFEAPADDRYRMSSACHVANPATGVRVSATGTMQASRGLPAGAATPVE